MCVCGRGGTGIPVEADVSWPGPTTALSPFPAAAPLADPRAPVTSGLVHSDHQRGGCHLLLAPAPTGHDHRDGPFARPAPGAAGTVPRWRCCTSVCTCSPCPPPVHLVALGGLAAARATLRLCTDGVFAFGGGGVAGMHWKRGEVPPPFLEGAQLMRCDCPPDGKCELQWHL